MMENVNTFLRALENTFRMPRVELFAPKDLGLWKS